jgi:hypothetical protein
MRIASFALGAFLLAAQPLMATAAMAQEGAAAPTESAKPPVAEDANKEICRGEKPTGTRLAKKKVCRTKAEWDEYYRQQREETEHMQRNDMANKTPRSG